jgi:DNA-directed RNA polymerase subunit RPC12/RpoP
MEEQSSGDVFIFNCPICGHAVEAPREVIGMQAECPDCESQITVPDPDKPEGVEDEDVEVFDLSDVPLDERKATMRIDIPDEEILFQPVKRKVTIKRRHK